MIIDATQLKTEVTTLVTNIIAFIPDLILAIVVLAIGWIIARVLSGITERIARRIGLSKIVDRVGFGHSLKQAGVDKTAEQMLAMIVYWLILLNFLIVALDIIGLDAAVEPLQQLIALFPSILVALATLIAGTALAQFVGKAVQATVASMGLEFHENLGRLAQMFMMLIVIIIVLEQLSIDVGIVKQTFVVVIALVVAGLALAFALGGRDVARNALAGYYARDTFEPGQTVVVDGQEGVLSAIRVLNSEIETPTHVLIVPNTRLIETNVIIK